MEEEAKARKVTPIRFRLNPYFIIVIALPTLLLCYYLIELIEFLKSVGPSLLVNDWGFLLIGTLLLLTPLWWRAYCAIEAQREKKKDHQANRELLQAVTVQVRQGGTLEYVHQGAILKLSYPTQGRSAQPVVTVHEEQALLEGPKNEPAAPSQQFLLSSLPQNGLIVSPGIRRSTSEVVRVSIPDVTHFKIIGSSGFGKSCLAAALLDQATSLNSPDILRIALLDLENKTSRIFQDRPHVAEFKIGQRSVPVVATNVDEVLQHFGLLKNELNRRTKLSEDDLEKEPVLLVYVEELLALQYELDDPKLLEQLLAQLTILALRGRKYRIFLLCCSQTDYSSDGLRVAQKQFRFRAAGGIDLTAARAAGFMSTELIKENFKNGQPGQGLFVVEFPSFADRVIAPRYNWKEQLALLKETRKRSETDVKNQDETNWQAKVDVVRDLLFKGWGKVAIIEKVWQKKPGATDGYRNACTEYDQIVELLSKE